MRIHVLVLAAAIVVANTGCATIVNTPKQKVVITSEPSNANVWIDGNYSGVTPHTTKLKRSKPHTVRVQKMGCEDAHRAIGTRFSGMIFGNILFGGLIGTIVDLITGSSNKLTPAELNIDMDCDESSLTKGGV